jgi:hypothetical protein
MKKLFVHLSMLTLLAALLLPLIGCKKEETEVEETPATSAVEEPATTSAEPMATDMGTGTTDTMGSDMGTSTPMGTEMTPPAK